MKHIPGDYDFDDRDLHIISYMEFLHYSRPKKREYFTHMRDYYGYTSEDFAKELETNVGTINVWASRVGFHFVNRKSDRQIKSRSKLIAERTISAIGPDAPEVRLCYE